MSPWRAAPTLVGRHVTLRPIERSDQAALVEAAQSGGTDRQFTTIAPSIASGDRWIESAFRDQEWGRAMVFAVLDPAGAVIGATRFLRMNEGDRRVEIGGTFYAASAQRTGANTDAKRLLLTHAFDVLGCQCVQLRTDWLNRRSRAAIERLGAKQDGVLRGHRVMPDGRVRDTVVYSVLTHEWPGVRANLEQLLERHER